MKDVVVVLPKGELVISSVVGAYKVFRQANHVLTSQGSVAAYNVIIAGDSNESLYYNGVFSIRPEKHWEEINKVDLIIIPAFHSDPLKAATENQELADWIYRQHRHNGTEVASLCTGAFVLAKSGLLHGKTCSTHWMFADAFTDMFPSVNLQPQEIITEDGGIYSSGGAYSFLNLLLHLVEKYNGKDLAHFLAKIFEIEYGRNNQGQFAMFNGQRAHKDDHIHKAQDYIESRIEDKLSVEVLADISGISKRNFIRKFKKATRFTPGEYIQRYRIEAAKRYLEHEDSNVSEAMYRVGYNDGKAFREIFKRFTGMSPSEYKAKYTRSPLELAS